MFILSSVLFFFIGCVCGWFGHKHRQSAKTTISQPAPVYEDLQPTSMPENRERAFELKENVAYGPIPATQICRIKINYSLRFKQDKLYFRKA